MHVLHKINGNNLTNLESLAKVYVDGLIAAFSISDIIIEFFDRYDIHPSIKTSERDQNQTKKLKLPVV